MASTITQIFTDPTTLSILATAVATATYSAYRANESLRKMLDPSSQRHAPSLSDHIIDRNSTVLETSTALLLPIVATVSIILLFFFLSSIGFVLTAISTVSGFISVLFMIWPIGEFAARRLRATGLSLPTDGAPELAILAPFVALLILTWLFTGHWLPNNIIGIALCVLFTSICKVPNLKAAVAIFAGLFVYDIFFVFFSERFFGRNVMVEVATSEPTNPAYAIANYLSLPITPVKKLALPAKLIIPGPDGSQTILGLGDIILPTILMVYLLEIDTRDRMQPLRHGYFPRVIASYVFGLTASFFCNFTFGAAQPALLYIVPALLITTLGTAICRDQLSLLWNGPSRGPSDNSHRDEISRPVLERGVSHPSSAKDDETTSLMA